METTDYHNFSHRGSSQAHREKLYIGDIYCNAIECKLCGYYIRSRNKHDMVWCKCKSVAIDGGSHYSKISGNPENYISRIEMFTDIENSS